MERIGQPVTAGVLSALVGFTSSSAVVLAGLRGVGPDVPRRRSRLLGAGRGPARPRRADRAPRQKLTECFPIRVFITGAAGRFGFLAMFAGAETRDLRREPRIRFE
jgi:hypothetical protein